MIEIISPNQLLRDGEDLGAVFDAVANHSLNMPDVQRAFLAYCAKFEEAGQARDKQILGLTEANNQLNQITKPARREAALKRRDQLERELLKAKRELSELEDTKEPTVPRGK